MMLAPWYIFLFVGVFDWGFFAHGLLSTENAARVGAVYYALSGGDSTWVCNYALWELRTAVNISGALTTCNSLPVIVTTSAITGPDGASAYQVAVEYQTQNLIPIPFLLNSQYTFYRVVKMRK
jgi:hypothetical protein